MNRSLDRLDRALALGLFAVVTVWALRWSYPCPHPDQWAVLVPLSARFPLAALGVLGRLALGAFAAFAYLVLRTIWIDFRSREDVLPDAFFHTRLLPLCAATIGVTMPCVWRSGQFLTPGFALVVLSLPAVILWICGRKGRNLLFYASAYVLFAFVGAFHPLGFAQFLIVVFTDIVLQWRIDQSYRSRSERDLVARIRRMNEVRLAYLAVILGFVLGFCALVVVSGARRVVIGVVGWLVAWWRVWLDLLLHEVFRPATATIAVALVVTAVALALARRIRLAETHGPDVRILVRVFSVATALAAAVMFLRAVDRPVRVRLSAMREYAKLVAEDIREVGCVFTDGRFDDLLRLELAGRADRAVLLNMLGVPSPRELARLKAFAPELNVETLFETGGGELLRTWAAERPDRLAASAWQLGEGVVRRNGGTSQRTYGAVVRCETADGAQEADAADARFAGWSRRILAIAETRPDCGPLLGGGDRAVEARFDALLWRAARIAGLRAERAAGVRRREAFEEERGLMTRLDDQSAILRRARGEAGEKMFRTARTALTPRMALSLALKWADFKLARPYAEEVVAETPDDPSANFALGMAAVEAKEFGRAVDCFERALKGGAGRTGGVEQPRDRLYADRPEGEGPHVRRARGEGPSVLAGNFHHSLRDPQASLGKVIKTVRPTIIQ